jgi:hypothetical protein
MRKHDLTEFRPKGICYIEAWAAIGLGVAAAGSIAGSAISASGAEGAAQTQAQAAEQAQQISENEFQTITGQEQPWMTSGLGAQSQLNYLLGNGTPGQGQTAESSGSGAYGSLLTPFTAQNMQQYSPAYQFQLQQGQQGVLNQDASAQGSLSGASLKDLIGFNQNYANTAYNNAFNQYQTQQGNIYSRLAGVSQLGQAAAANTGQQGTALAGQAAQSATNIGSALGAGQAGAAGAYAGGASSIGGLGLLGALYQGNTAQNQLGVNNFVANNPVPQIPTAPSYFNSGFSDSGGPG